MNELKPCVAMRENQRLLTLAVTTAATAQPTRPSSSDLGMAQSRARCKFIKVQFNQSNEIKWPFWSFLTKVMKSSGHIGPLFVLVNSSHSHFDSTHFQHKERLSRTEQSYIFNTLEIKTFGLDSRIRDVEVGGLKNHNFLP